ncbi:amidohydrolase family protein [Ramlibacter sp. MMS24-I3-19]|uniref:amidohydrolase family protein n=1 Tax=Ramlibacter sp. MMS24-I3-19 TaxID=3416606 RepID=UPI003D055859
MIIDCHGHFTTAPPQVPEFRKRQLAALASSGSAAGVVPPVVTDEEIRAAISGHQLRRMRERGVDLTIFSPKAVAMDHHQGDEAANVAWARFNNELVHRVCRLFPEHFAGACQLPQTPGVAPGARVFEELERCVKEYGFVAANVNPDPTGGRWADPPLWDRKWWYPLYEKLVELDVPAMIHVSGSCNPHFDAVATHYINGDTTAFVQFMKSDIFRDFPTLKFIIPHGGGAVPFHWGRYRGLAQDMGLPPLEEKVLRNVYFDTCVYHQAGIDLLLRVVPAGNILFASETFGAVQGIDPRTQHHFDDTRRYVEASADASAADKARIFAENALGVYPRLRAHPRCGG